MLYMLFYHALGGHKISGLWFLMIKLSSTLDPYAKTSINRNVNGTIRYDYSIYHIRNLNALPDTDTYSLQNEKYDIRKNDTVWI